jgi:hypothetical protein
LAGRIEKLMPVSDIALVESLEGRAGRNHQVERDFWQTSRVWSFLDCTKRLSILI